MHQKFTRLHRQDSLAYLYDFFLVMGVNQWEGWQLWLIDCLSNSDADPCHQHITELQNQFRKGGPSRMHIKEQLHLNHRRLANDLGYYLGPYYTINEKNILISWEDSFRTKFSKVLKFGQRTETLVPKSAPTEREFLNIHYTEHPDLLGDTIQFTYHTDQVLSEEDLCNLRIYPDDQYDTYRGHRLRPFEVVSYDSNSGELVIQMPIWIAVKRDCYIFFPTPGASKLITSIDGCDPNTYISDINIRIETFQYPHGYVTLKKTLCNNCVAEGVTLCPACTNLKLPFCVVPVDPENGEFKIKPLIYDEDLERYIQVDFSSCCSWVESVQNDACEDCEGCGDCCAQCQVFCDPCSMNDPLHISYSYLSGCSEHEYNACCFEDNIVCYPEALYALAASNLISCDCAPCSAASIEHYSKRVWEISQETRTGIFTHIFNDKRVFRFGYTFGAVEAATILLNAEYRKEYVII